MSVGPSTLLAAGALLAVVAAVRGLWSPCGLSMISAITPMSERSRGHRFWATVCWFVVGGIVGGATLGLGMAAGAWALAQTGASESLRLALLAAAALVTIASDLGVVVSLPIHPRQVNETWLPRLRSWAYASGFGWQIGVGVATYIMTAGVYLTIAVGVLSASPVVALGIGTLFGLVRGLGVWVSAGATSPDRLRALHATLDRWARPVAASAIAAQCLVGIAALLASPAPVAVTGSVLAVCITVAALPRRDVRRT